jgi:hypothetical protein
MPTAPLPTPPASSHLPRPAPAEAFKAACGQSHVPLYTQQGFNAKLLELLGLAGAEKGGRLVVPPGPSPDFKVRWACLLII